jgi:DNA invertase Pin-like site-specific DNA recombinase
MKKPSKKLLRCAIYTRKSTEHNLDLEFNSLDAQREACEAYIKSQAHEGWRLIPARYDDGAFSGASLDRPALQELLAEVGSSRIDVIVVYKVDRLTRSLADFAKLVELFDQHSVSFVSVTQSFNTTSSMGRLTLNVLLSFAQFEREVNWRARPRQDCGFQAQGDLGRRIDPPGLCEPQQEARHRARRSRDGPSDFPAILGIGLHQSLGPGPEPEGHSHETTDP